ncbi:hypothetical protein CHS0354_037049 [Potamilus streckersoni]|uniref:Uncharacterized protein n=1 Tax=Potamilus streckersoni TaxID=2493646 RepID=A0AAE0SKR1_9BIVA|nr:hypothetical protein CHS0354_037049 [Potamilus streckersoni]
MFVIRLAALVTGSISFYLIVIGVSIPYWIYIGDKERLVPSFYSNVTFARNLGFWEYCEITELDGVLHSECRQIYGNRSDMTNASAAMMLIGMLMMAGSVVVCVTSILCMKENKLLPIIGGVCSLFAGLCMLIGVALYGHEYREEIFQYGPSFYMAIVATTFALVSGNIQIASRTIFTKPDMV